MRAARVGAGGLRQAVFSVLERRFRSLAPAAEDVSLRVVHERNEHLTVRRGVVQPVHISEDTGAMATVHAGGGTGYAASADLSTSGLGEAIRRAREWALNTARAEPLDPGDAGPARSSGEYASREAIPWDSIPIRERLDLLRGATERLKVDARITDWEGGLWRTEIETLFLTADGARIFQRFRYLLPTLSATANSACRTQTRTFGGHAYCLQGGLEILDDVGFAAAAPRVGGEAVELLLAPDCPGGTMDVVLAPDQMILQIHESIGHPLELDRILGDERNYAGASFVTLDMFGTYAYGSALLNVTFDPTRPNEIGSYAFDDEGEPARRAYVIRDGILLRPLGGATSQARAGIAGVASARASSWNRPPIDRMANLNLEPGTTTFAELVGRVERGVYMETNCSWSIDDTRNKFQFGCEYARRIVDGRLGEVVKNPNYRGVSATFWRSLAAVGDATTLRVLGTPYCGKGEPNQLARIGHAAPACRFTGVEVFGGV